MITVAMCYSIFQVPRCRIHAIAGSWWGNFHSLSRTDGNSSSFKILASNASGLEGHSRRWIRKSSTSKKGGSKITLSSKTSDTRHEISEGTITSSTCLNINNPELVQKIQYCDVQQKFAENQGHRPVTVLCFDIETTGLGRETERVIEIAIQDLAGGVNSTFQTLVNPERSVPNSYIHGISTHMVNRPNVPRMKDLIPIILDYVKSREKPNGRVLFVAHNGRSFDVPFLIKEFSRCGFEIPEEWSFVDSIQLAREVAKLPGSKGPPKVSLQALREHYEIPIIGSAHRAMSDVDSLAWILQRMTFELKLTVSDLVERSFTASDLIKLKKKKGTNL